MKKRFFLLVGITAAALSQSNHPIIQQHASSLALGMYVDFDLSMGKQHPLLQNNYQRAIASQADQKTLEICKKLYQKNNLANRIPTATPKIPKIIHQIWLGSPVPEKFHGYIESWKTLHPDWEYKLWTDADIERFGLENQTYYNAAVNYAERSDIARYEILYHFGGVYVDIDMESVKPIDVLHHTYDFYAGIEPPADAPFLERLVIISNAIIGTVPGHPLLRRCIDRIESCSCYDDIIVRTGPLFFTDTVLDHLDSPDKINIALPTSFLFPFGKNLKSLKEIEQCIKPETFVKHHWAGSWIFNPKAFIPGYSFTIKVIEKDAV